MTRTDRDQGSRVLEAWNLGGHRPVSVTTAFKRLLRLDDINVVAVEFLGHLIVVTVVLRRRRLICPHFTIG